MSIAHVTLRTPRPPASQLGTQHGAYARNLPRHTTTPTPAGHNDIYAAPGDLPLLDKSFALAGGGAAAVSATSRSQKPRTPPPDIPSLMLDARIVYLGMPLVPAVTELIVSELLYLQYADRIKPVFIYINSTGTTRADGETVGFETEGTAIYDTMCYLKNQVRVALVCSSG